MSFKSIISILNHIVIESSIVIIPRNHDPSSVVEHLRCTGVHACSATRAVRSPHGPPAPDRVSMKPVSTGSRVQVALLHHAHVDWTDNVVSVVPGILTSQVPTKDALNSASRLVLVVDFGLFTRRRVHLY